MKLIVRSRTAKRDYLLTSILEKLAELGSAKGRISKYHVLAIHAFYSTQFEALRKLEIEQGYGNDANYERRRSASS